MELRHLRYFLAVAAHGNFTRAAAALGIQQPPLSQQVRALERELGFALFHRLPRGVELTEGGLVLREEVQALLAAVERGVGRASRAAQGLAGSLAVGFTSSAVTHPFAAALIRRYGEAHPGIELAIHEANAARVTEAVVAGRLDAAFIRLPVSEVSGLAYHIVIEEKLVLAIPAGHPQAQDARRRGIGHVRLRDFAPDAFILVRRPGAQGMYGHLIAACQRLGFAPRIAAEVDHMLTNIMLVAAGVGVSVVPASMRDIHRDAVFYAEPKDAPELVAPLTLVTRLDATNPTVGRFVQFTLALAMPSGRLSRPSRARGGGKASAPGTHRARVRTR